MKRDEMIDVYRLFDEHRFEARWLELAEEFLARDVQQDKTFYSEVDYERQPLFTVSLPRSVWEPQVRAEVERVRKRVNEMDERLRNYIAAVAAGKA